MSFHWVFNKCMSAVKSDVEEYWGRKWQRLQKLLAPSYAPELQDVRVTFACHQQNPQRVWYDIHAVIGLPTGTLVAKSHDKQPRAAVDKVVDRLAAEIIRHKERLRKDYVFKRKTRPRADLSAAGPQTSRQPTVEDRQLFTRLIRPLLPVLKDHIRRELKVLEIEEVLHRNELTVADLTDEVLTRAWERFADRPQNESLEKWLIDILHDTLEDLIKQEPRPHEALEEEVDETLPSEVPQVDEQEWWSWLLGYEDPLQLEDYVARLKDSELLEHVEAEDELQNILSLVSELLPPLQRQAFILNVLDGFEPFEIAMIQNRPESAVLDDIETAKLVLRKRMREEIGERQLASTATTPAASSDEGN
jgi:RNA polymerase sigma factor (sigma-70 family)